VLGFIALEIPRTATGREVGFEEQLEAVFAGLPSDVFPHHVRLARRLSQIISEEQFETGVALILDGVAGR
jgi:hypothetical protein